MVAFSPRFSIASAPGDLKKSDRTKTRKKTFPSKHAQDQSRWFRSGARNVPTATAEAPLEFRVRVLFGPGGLAES